MDVTFKFDKMEVKAVWNDSKTAKAIFEKLPVQSHVQRWGDEIYFTIPIPLPAENATEDLNIGDIAYWPEGACLCLFFGKTPASTTDRPKPASEVNIVGHFDAPPAALRKIRSGTTVKVFCA